MYFSPSDMDKTMKSGSQTASTSDSTVTDGSKDKNQPPAVVTLQDNNNIKPDASSSDPFIAFAADMEETEEQMDLEEEEEQETEEEKKVSAMITPTNPKASKSSPIMYSDVADIKSDVAMQPNAGNAAAAESKQGSTTSTTSSVTDATNFTSPSKKGKKILPKSFGSPSSGPKSTMRSPAKNSPTFEVHFWQTGCIVSCVCFLLGKNKKENYAWKQFLVERVIKGASGSENQDWIDFNFTPTIMDVKLENRRAIPHGPDEALTGWNEYPERFLCFSLTSNPDFENTRAKVEALGKRLLEMFRFHEFPSYYVGEMEQAFNARKMSNSLQESSHELWKIIENANLVLVEEENLDSFFMDEKIQILIPPALWKKSTKEWPQTLVRKLYRSGELPPWFEDMIAK